MSRAKVPAKQKNAARGKTDKAAGQARILSPLDDRICQDDCDSCQMLGLGASCADCAIGKRILIVGGIERMETKYRQVIEKEGGVLDYHSGNMQGGVKKLERCLQRADIVLCPVTCNSHGACTMVKRLGKKHKKPVHMMPNFSLHAISRALNADF